MRAQLRRSFLTRLKLVFAVAIIASGSLPAVTSWAQDSGAASFTVASASGNVVIKRANGTSETATPGTQLYANDQLASVGRSEAMLNTVGQGSGASLMVYSDTTIGVRSARPGAGTFYVADIAQGVVLARTPPTSGATLQVTAESVGAVAQVNPGGGMAVASDVGTGTIAVSCEDRQSQVYFPYPDWRVPCENNVVRTLSNQRTVDDSRADSNSPITAAVQAAGTNVAAEKEAENVANPQGAVNRSNSKESSEEKEKESDAAVAAPPVVASPAPVLAVPCGQTFTFIDTTSPASVTIELGRTSGTIAVGVNGGGTLADRFDLVYEGRSLPPFPIFSSGIQSFTVSYSGSSTQVTMNVNPGPVTNPTNDYAFSVSCPTSGSSPASISSEGGLNGETP